MVERRVHWKKSKIRNTNKITFDRLNLVTSFFDLIPSLTPIPIPILILTPTLAVSFHYGLINPPYQRKKRSPKNIQLTAPNAR